MTHDDHLTGQLEEPPIDVEAIDSMISEAMRLIDKSSAPPKKLILFALMKRPYFPSTAGPLTLEPGLYAEAIKQLHKTPHKCLALCLTKNDDAKISKLTQEDLYSIGVMARIVRITPLENGGVQAILNIERRIRIRNAAREKKLLLAEVEYLEEKPLLTKELKAYSVSIISTIKELLSLNPLFKEELQIILNQSDVAEPGKLADFAAALTNSTREELQGVLECLEIPERVDRALLLLKKELDLSLLQSKINKKIEGAISKNQREFFLREQLKTIKRELGIEKDDKAIERLKFEDRIKKKRIPEDALNTIREELDKLSSLDPHSSEYGVCRGYLDWLTIIPWGNHTKENHDLKKAESVLHKEHFGLDDIKERILEFISVGKLSGGVKGSILCLVGPPGVGKTSIGKSIAKALNRKFYRFSVGGMRDEAEIKGHRRTYIGAMPGKLIQALKTCQAMNPVIMLDEVDKIGASAHGDPASALLEVLDPEQNKDFLDHYLDVRCDLSHILFIVTANVLDTIPDALKDRMDILRLSGYIQEEKVAIAEKFLIPKNRKEMGLQAKQIAIGKKAIEKIIDGYAREAGVRSLEGAIKKILRKAAHRIVKDSVEEKIVIDENSLQTYLGKPHFNSDRFHMQTPVGTATGLAWTSMGGATLYIETIKIPSERLEMKLTGQAGPVMKESSEIAWTYLQSALNRYAPLLSTIEKAQVHIHIPEGATPKDGPSAGITMTTALLSLLLNRKVQDDLGMTGELTLSGKVLPIGGVKEKIVAARRSGLKALIFPRENMRDVEELPSYLKEGLAIHFVSHYDEVFPIAFPESECKS